MNLLKFQHGGGQRFQGTFNYQKLGGYTHEGEYLANIVLGDGWIGPAHRRY
jgi:hypothetical protein